MNSGISEYLAPTSKHPIGLQIRSAKGSFLIDKQGNKYLDLISGISVANLGYANPLITKAIQQQAEAFTHVMVYGEFNLRPQKKLAEKLISILPSKLNQLLLVNSGSEAVEATIKLVRKFTKRTEIICLENAYHGSTIGALSLIGDPLLRQPYLPLLTDIKRITLNDKNAAKEITTKTACVIMEPVMGEAGYLLCQKDFIKAIHKKCQDTKTLLVFDEIQTAIGRTGKKFAFEHFNVVPEILLLAKSFGGGLPLGALVANSKLLETFAENPALGHITTFGGNPISCAAALASLNQLIEDQTIAKIRDKEKLFRQGLKHRLIEKIDGIGLMLGVTFNKQIDVQELCKTLLKNGILTDWFLFDKQKIRISPSLEISETEIIHATDTIIKSLD